MKVVEKLNREEYLSVNKYIKSLGGYYSRFKHAFIFKENPSEKLNISAVNLIKDEAEEKQDEKIDPINYIISEDVHTKTNSKIWIVKPEKELNKVDFGKIKQKFATLQGYYSSFKHGFIFKYDPTEV